MLNRIMASSVQRERPEEGERPPIQIIGHREGHAPVVITVGSQGDGDTHIKQQTVIGVADGVVENAYVAGIVQGDINVSLTESDHVDVSESTVSIRAKTMVYTEDHKAKRLQGYTRDVIEKEVDVYVPTNAYNTAVKCLEKYSYVTIIGGPGSGKTTLAYRILRDYQGCDQKQTGYDLFIITDCEKMKHRRNPKRPTVFLIDDILGKTTFSRDTLKKWKGALEELEPILGKRKGKKSACLKLVITCRDYIFKEADFGFLSYSVFKEDAIVSITFTHNEKVQMLKRHNVTSSSPLTDGDVRQVASMESPYGFPYICSLFFKLPIFHNVPVKFFSNPLPFLKDSLKDLSVDFPEQYAGLLLVLMNEGEVNIANLSNSHFHLQEIVRVKELEIQSFIENRYRIFSKMCGSFLSRDSDTFSFPHEAVKLALVCVEGRQNSPLITENPSMKSLYDGLCKGAFSWMKQH